MYKKLSIIISLVICIVFFSGGKVVLAQDASEEGNTVLQKVKEKIDSLKRNPIAYIGAITDKTDTSIQVRTNQGKIELVSVTDTTKYSKITGTNESDINFEDIAIGDYILALGTLENAQVLSTRRIILTSPPRSDKKIVNGRVSAIVRREITIESSESSTTLTFPARWKGPEIRDISEGDIVLAVGIVAGGKETLRTIEIID